VIRPRIMKVLQATSATSSDPLRDINSLCGRLQPVDRTSYVDCLTSEISFRSIL